MHQLRARSQKTLSATAALIVFASSLTACKLIDRYTKPATEIPPYATLAPEDASEQIVIINNRESAQERNKNRNVTDALKRMQGEHKILPDRRFLLAVADIHKLITGEEQTSVELFYTGKGWSVKYKGEDVGTLSKLPGGEELFDFLAKWAKVVKNKTSPSIISGNSAASKPVATISSIELFKTFSDATSEKQGLDASKAESAASAAAWLSIISIDEAGFADQFYSKALALAACSTGAESTEKLRTECLLADSLSYFAHARKIAARLPSGDTVKLYMEQDLAALEKVCGQSDKLDQATFLYLMSLARIRDSDQWLKVLREHPRDIQEMSLPIARTACEFAGEKMQLPVGHYLMVAASREVQSANGRKQEVAKQPKIDFQDIAWSYEKARESTEWTVGDLSKTFESGLHKSSLGSDGKEKSSAYRDDYYRAIFATGIYRVCRSLLMLHIDKFRVALSAKSIATDKGSLLGLGLWLEDLIKIKESEADPSDLSEKLTALRNLGARPLADLILQCGSYARTRKPYRLFPAGRRVLDFSDTRPETRLALADVSDNILMYPALTYKLHLSAIKDGDSNSIGSKIERAIALRKISDMVGLLQSALLTEYEALRLLQRLEHMGASVQSLTALYGKASQKHVNSWEFTESNCNFLIRTKQYAAATEILRSFIANTKQANSHELIRAKCMLASIALTEKRFGDGLKDLEKLENTEQAKVLLLKSRLLEGLNRREEAEVWAKEAFKRFPRDPECVALNAELLWRNGKNAEAAQLLSDMRGLLSFPDWRDYIAPAFARVFASNPNAMLVAVGTLLDVQISGPDTLGQIARSMYVADHPEEAFKILTKVGQQGVEAGDLYTCAYRYLKRAKGEKFALAWLTSGIARQDRINLIPYAFFSGQFELLWSLDPTSPSQDEIEKLWLTRTAACLVDANLMAKYKSAICEHFKASKHSTADLGRYMLNLTRAYPVKPLTDEQQCRYAFYIGWKVLATGEDFFGGTELYHLALESDRPDLNEFRWSEVWLNDLMIMLQNNPAVMESAFYHKLRIEGPEKNGDFGSQRRFKIHAFN